MSLTFTNKSNAAIVSVCLIWYNSGCTNPPFRKSGWWNIAKGESKTVLTGDLNARYYYFHAEGTDGEVWGDNSRRVAVVDTAFDVCFDTIFEPNRIVGMNEIDTGPYLNYTINLIS